MQKTERRKRQTEIDFLPKNVKFEPKMPPWGGGPPSHFFNGFWRRGPKWCPRGLQGEPRGAQSHPKYQLFLILHCFWMDFDVILATFGCSRECPSHKMNIKIWAAFPPLLLKSARMAIDIWFCQSTTANPGWGTVAGRPKASGYFGGVRRYTKTYPYLQSVTSHGKTPITCYLSRNTKSERYQMIQMRPSAQSASDLSASTVTNRNVTQLTRKSCSLCFTGPQYANVLITVRFSIKALEATNYLR